MIDAKDLLQFQVGDQSIVGVEAAKKDTSVYRLDVRGINSADARLIAAAPTMLEALKGMRAEWEKLTRYGSPMAKAGNEAVQAMNAAIALAEGRTPAETKEGASDE